MLFDSWLGRIMGSQPEDDARLVATARRDPAAFGALYHRYVTPVYRYLHSHVGDRAEAEDLTAQVFEAALRGLNRYREQGSFAAWLFRIAHNKAASYHRGRRDPLSIERIEGLTLGDPDPSDTLELQERFEKLERLLRRLEPEQLEMLRLRFAADLPFAQIGKLIGRSEAATKMTVHRLLERLGRAWESEDEAAG